MEKFLNRKLYLVFAFLVCLFAAYFLEKSNSSFEFSDSKLKNVQEVIFEKEAKTQKVFDTLVSLTASPHFLKKINAQLGSQLRVFSSKDDISLFILKDDTLRFWSDNKVPISNFLNGKMIGSSLFKNKFDYFQNGWYEVLTKKSGSYFFIAFILIKNEYSYQNNHLKNQFQKDFNLSSDVIVSLEKSISAEKVYSKQGDFLFSLIDQSPAQLDLIKTAVIILLYLFVFLLFAQLVKRFYCFIENKYGVNPALISSILLLCFVRFLMILFKFPKTLYQTSLFSPIHYASSFLFSSLGDFLLNALLIAVFSAMFYGLFKLDSKIYENKRIRYFLGFFLLLIPAVFSKLIEFLLQDLIQNSSISFDLNKVFNLSLLSHIGFFSVGILLMAFIILSFKVLKLLSYLKFNLKELVILFAVFILLSQIYQFNSIPDFFISLWPFVVLLILWRLIHKSLEGSYFIGDFLMLVFAISLFTTYKLIHQNNLKEQKNRVFLAMKIGEEKDPVLEYLFVKLEKELLEDKNIKNLFGNYWENKSNTDDYIKGKYLQGYWQKYDVQITACEQNDSLFINADKTYTDCQLFFGNIIATYGNAVNNSKLYYLSNNSGRISYLAHLKVSNADSMSLKYKDLYIEFDSKFIPAGGGYPELLLDLNQDINGLEKLNYSFAKYKNHGLISKAGTFNYSFSDREFENNVSDNFFFDSNGYSHLLYNNDNDSLIVLSLKKNAWLEYLTTFSFLFVFYCFIVLLILLIRQKPQGFNFYWRELKNKIPILIIGIVIFSSLLIGFGSVFFIKNQYKEKNHKMLSEKIKSVLTEIQDKSADIRYIDQNTADYFSFFLQKFSGVFFSDINLYDLNGDLISSSRKEVFDLGLIDRKMNSEAYKNMNSEGRTEFVQEEKIGGLTYFSAYCPVRSAYGETIAYLNLPYFSKQSDLEEEISVFLSALINMYMILFVFSAVIALVISRYITEPLQLIKSKLSGVKLGKANELIEWKGKDEIGKLINEYNRMVEALSESADRLAKSERESAWREMAKQVAHEIKNPLTPIKLGAQLIERAWKDKAPDFDLRLEKYIKTLTEQIDALVHIAGEFSNFAQMPKAKTELLNLIEIIENVMVLFADNENLSIKLVFENSSQAQNILVNADKDQIIRVFNNLIKNGAQSVADFKKPEIVISIEKSQNAFIVAVKDNGQGISDELKDKIFSPNFTTKNTGMGLGLTMVKNIIENMGGEIWFSSSKDQGTTFYFTIPLSE